LLTLKSSTDFQRVRRDGRSWSHPLVVLIADKHDHPEARYGFAAGKSVGNAVVRNRAKRRMRAAVRAQLKQINIAPQWDLIFIARAPFAKATWLQINEAFRQLINKAKLQK
jgi:ribonuclease P protein component